MFVFLLTQNLSSKPASLCLFKLSLIETTLRSSPICTLSKENRKSPPKEGRQIKSGGVYFNSKRGVLEKVMGCIFNKLFYV